MFSGTAIYTAVEKIGGISISQTVLILVVTTIILGFMGFLFWAWLDAWKTAQRIKIEVDSKTDVNKKDLEWI